MRTCETWADPLDPDPRVRLSLIAWPQSTEWAALQAIGRTIEELGFDALWTWDHLYPIRGRIDGPSFEGYLTLAGWAAVTERIPMGLMVGAVPFRNPALVAKMVTTLDHMTGGRMIAGMGGAWFEEEHTAFGIDFGESVGMRLDWLDEAMLIIRGMLDGARPSGRRFYQARDVINEPPPIQRHLPMLIGGSGEQKTLATVARYADIWNVGEELDVLRHKEAVLRRWCAEVGRNPNEIERNFNAGVVVIRRTRAAAEAMAREILRVSGGWEGPLDLVATPDEAVDRLAPNLELGYRHFMFDYPAPYDLETLELLQAEVRPALDARLSELRVAGRWGLGAP
jgi:alkanesulfonate monooxygenase SsuD/methylene tetrahydromethanopterin reductase-like flavin-dependent oxidoreductase (luciferase family)